MRAKSKLRVQNQIPSASMGDIAMLLLIFFMSTVIFRMETGLPVSLPRSEAGERVPRENSVRIWIDAGGNLSIDDNLVTLPDIEPIIADKLSRNPSLIIAFNTDKRCAYRVVSEAMEYLKNANALRVSFTAPTKRGGEEEP